LTYRLNRGDIRAIAEVWMARAYELPFDIRPVNIIDLGANIGAAAVWFATRYGGSKLVAVEPVPENARLARINLARLGIDAEVIEAAVGPRPGVARFAVTENSTWGHLSDNGLEVTLVTPQALIDRFPPDERIDLLKMDIEGGEQALFESDLAWLRRVDCLAVELHTDQVDWRAIAARLEQEGFARYPISEGNLYRGPTDLMAAFRRTSSAGAEDVREATDRLDPAAGS
jgi:FkbM family methyltransferase